MGALMSEWGELRFEEKERPVEEEMSEGEEGRYEEIKEEKEVSNKACTSESERIGHVTSLLLHIDASAARKSDGRGEREDWATVVFEAVLPARG